MANYSDIDADILMLNGMSYTFNVQLRNASKDINIRLPKVLFKELVLEETFMDWASKGYIIYDNNYILTFLINLF